MTANPSASHLPGPGDIIEGKYRVEKQLGQGGMGIVYLATHIHLGERVAVKLLLPEFLRNAEVVERFVREARAAVQIQSEHVGRVTDVGTSPGQPPYLVMEYLEGEDLGRVLQRGPLPVETACDYLLQACDAIAWAHARGIVHRDLKPANLFLSRRTDGGMIVKVLDFGISKISGLEVDEASGGLTKTSAMLGSPLYMAPEQLRASRDVDRRADLWSLGVVLYELVTGDVPFKADSVVSLYEHVKEASAVPFSTLDRRVPVSLDPILSACLRPDRDERYSNVEELAQAIAPFATEATRVRVLPRIADVTSKAGHSVAMARAKPAGSGRTVAAIALTLAVVVAGTAAGAYWILDLHC